MTNAIAETELSVLSQQCLKRRLESAEKLEREVVAWQQERNEKRAQVSWQFTTEDARVTLRHLYPRFEEVSSSSN
ncbi:hypothetical protein HFV01_25265 [Limnospira fusiformis SAG 85.79]|uniref:Transposase n=2 Tax=Limnospira TaxID=2596745 RepID=A0A9P1KB44_9CYAN|nr:transposase [Limnospira maxima CS-328]QJB28502.1 hypothetical protein HFV01_25265 [Limnospira fusiformis SAG 85.79]QNH58179.1 MAG: hypothetical protein H2674_01920 [Limnospira indica BM01]UWU51114.1 hypothetical protein APLC1_6074 [Arthrospira platensis C1]CDM92736.1 transposase [Limnospira indica PCC 8005]